MSGNQKLLSAQLLVATFKILYIIFVVQT